MLRAGFSPIKLLAIVLMAANKSVIQNSAAQTPGCCRSLKPRERKPIKTVDDKYSPNPAATDFRLNSRRISLVNKALKLFKFSLGKFNHGKESFVAEND